MLYFLSMPSILYKLNYGINIPNPIKLKKVIDSESRNRLALEVLFYKKKDIEKLKTKSFFKPIDDTNIEELKQLYEKWILNKYLNILGEEDKNIFNQYIKTEELFNKDNYYAFLDKNKTRYCFTLLFLDTQNNQMYAIISNINYPEIIN